MTGSIGTIDYRVTHRTRYVYSAEVCRALHWLHLTPRPNEYQQVQSHEIEIEPYPAESRPVVDAFGNNTLRVTLEQSHLSLSVQACMSVRISERPQCAAMETVGWEQLREELSYANRARSVAELEVLGYRLESRQVRIKQAFADFARPCFGRGEPVLVCAERLMQKLYDELQYAPGTTGVHTPLREVLETRRGVCQDFAHLMLACLRSLGLAARYVSGYLRTVAPPGARPLTGADASHAWISVYAPPFGWIDLDPTNNVRVNTDHVTLAWGRDFNDVSPLRGVLTGGGKHSLSVAVSVEPAAALARI